MSPRLIFSYPFIFDTRLRSLRSLRRYRRRYCCLLRRHALISRPFPCARCPPRQFLALHVKSPARREPAAKRQIHGRHALISRPYPPRTTTAPRITALRRSSFHIHSSLICRPHPYILSAIFPQTVRPKTQNL